MKTYRLTRLPARAVLAGALLLALSACSPTPTGLDDATSKLVASSVTAGPASSNDPARVVTYPASDYQPSEAAPKPPAGRPAGTLRISVPSDLPNLNSHSVTGPFFQWFNRLILDNLVYRDAAGNAAPWLAKSWEISPDGLTYTFHLRDDVSFSDGAKFNAEAVKVNLDHMVDPATKSSLAGRYIAPYRQGEIVDEYTFRAHLSEPYAPFLDVLAQAYLGMYSPKAIREKPAGLASAPVGSGPFVIEKRLPQQSLILVRRPDYHWAPPFVRHEGPAFLDRIEIDVVPEGFVRAGGLTSGQHDLSIDVAPPTAQSLRADPRLAVSSRIRQGGPIRALVFNVEKAPFDDVRVRRAVTLATDSESICRLLGFGEYSIKRDFLCSPTRDYNSSAQKALSYDPAAANRLLDEAGWTARDSEGYRTRNGTRLGAEVVFADGGIQPMGSALVAMQSDLKRIGFELTLAQLPLAQVTQRRQEGSYQALGGGGWSTNTPDGLYILYHGQEIITATTFGQNTSRLNDPALNDLLSRARRSMDPQERKALYFSAQKLLVDLAPAVPIHENQTIVAYNRRLRGLLFDTSHDVVFLTGAWLDESHP